jgi:DNA mismatch repair protein MutL
MNQDNKSPIQQIKKLPDFLVNQIAAGEVVERPASVVKELLENSLDAKATKIILELENGGKDLIKVIDNGVGLSQENFGLVFERHATSKIQTLDDLNSNSNLGFRGEALAAISSVSKTEFASNGFAITNEGELKAKAMPDGTQVIVSNLFFNVPARQKFLKTDATEYKKCLEVVESYALCHPEVGFKLVHNQKTVFDYPKCDNHQDRLTAIFGTDFQQKLLEVNYLGTETKILGYIGKPELATERAANQYIFVNGRPLEAPYFNHAVKNAFGSLIFPNQKPVFFFWITINPTDVDMNVHPRKLEARFHYQGIIYSLILKSVKSTLEKTSLTKTAELSKQSYENYIPKTNNYSQPSLTPTYNFSNFKPTTPQTPPSFNAHQEQEYQPPSPTNSFSEPTLTPLCQINNSYILCQTNEGILLIDQHAAHERVMYQKLKLAAQNKLKNTQPLLTPLHLELPISQLEILKQTKDVLASIGFEISDFGSNSIVVNAVPAKFASNDIDQLLQGLLKDLEEGHDFAKLEEIEDIVINYAACRGAIKFGQKLSQLEMEALISEMDQIKDKQYSCPHGRPTMITITYDELEKQFKRK